MKLDRLLGLVMMALLFVAIAGLILLLIVTWSF